MKYGQPACLRPWEAWWKIAGPADRSLLRYSRRGSLNFRRILGPAAGCSASVSAETVVNAVRRSRLPVSFGADQSVVWWVNGTRIYDTAGGDYLDPAEVTSHQFYAPLKKGRNVIRAQVSAGENGWSLILASLPPRPPAGSKQVPPDPPLQPARRRLPAGRKNKNRDYCAAGLRVENRPEPHAPKVTSARARIMAENGVEAHWIGIVDPAGRPYGSSRFLPGRADRRLADEARLRRQVRAIHRHGMAAMTWFPGSFCRSAAERHPSWRVVNLVETSAWPQARRSVCVNSPYGDALIGFVKESIRKYDLDGFWFDGTLWAVPGNVGCFCRFCAERFRAEEGCELPDRFDWRDPVFRRWVRWRYSSYMRFWARLAEETRRDFPRVRIVLNHPHRFPYWSYPSPSPIESWRCGVPVDGYRGDIVAALETCDTPFVGAFHSRLARAYGKEHSEVWTGLHWSSMRHDTWPEEMDPLFRYIHHALACLTAGAMPSFGTPGNAEDYARDFRVLAGYVNPRRRYAGGTAEKYAALYVSQQAETFYFSRRKDQGFPLDYWQSLLGWHSLLCESRFLLDVVFDSDFEAGKLAAYPVLVAPHAVSLSDRQLDILEGYVAGGGTLVAGSDLGARDAWGNPADPTRVRPLLGRPARRPVRPGALFDTGCRVTMRAVGKGNVLVFSGDAGLRFFRDAEAGLVREISARLKRCAPPKLEVSGPPRLHVGLFKKNGRRYLHLHNFIAYSRHRSFPNPVLTSPRPLRNIRVKIHGYPVGRARRVLLPGKPSLALHKTAGYVEFSIPEISWGEIVELC